MVIYLTTNKINGKKYLGKDTQNNPKYLGSGLDLKKAIEKYGAENFEKTILEVCNNKEELWKREEYWLNYYDVKNNKEFYNRTNKAFGSWEGRKFEPITEKTKQKMSMAHKDIPLSKEHKQAISDAMLGHSKTEEWKQNLSKSCTESFGKKVIQSDLKGNFIKEWNSGKQASQELGLSYTAINNCCRNNSKNLSRQRDKDKLGKYTSFNYIWEYKVI
jgi:group I intron endonuclease